MNESICNLSETDRKRVETVMDAILALISVKTTTSVVIMRLEQCDFSRPNEEMWRSDPDLRKILREKYLVGGSKVIFDRLNELSLNPRIMFLDIAPKEFKENEFSKMARDHEESTGIRPPQSNFYIEITFTK